MTETTAQAQVHTVTVGGQDLFTIELLDERPGGFSACVPELAIFTFGQTEEQALERVFSHVLEKYEDLLASPIPLNENEQAFLVLYRTKIIPTLVEQNLHQPPRPGFWKRLRRFFSGEDGWRAAFLESLKTSSKLSGV
jgi:predicted RNase H-like HicB family nuclease